MFQKESNCSETLRQAELTFFLEVISNPDEVGSYVLIVNGHRITVQSIIIELGLHIDSSTAKYDTHNLTAEILFRAIVKLSHRSEHSTSSTEITHEQ